MKTRFSKHALKKIVERELKIPELRKILKNPNLVYYDLHLKTMVAIGETKIADVKTNLIIPFVRERDTFRVITAYPCKNLEREIRKKEGRRWVRIK